MMRAALRRPRPAARAVRLCGLVVAATGGTDEALERPSTAQLLRYFLYLGSLGFGARWPS